MLSCKLCTLLPFLIHLTRHTIILTVDLIVLCASDKRQCTACVNLCKHNCHLQWGSIAADLARGIVKGH